MYFIMCSRLIMCVHLWVLWIFVPCQTYAGEPGLMKSDEWLKIVSPGLCRSTTAFISLFRGFCHVMSPHCSCLNSMPSSHPLISITSLSVFFFQSACLSVFLSCAHTPTHQTHMMAKTHAKMHCFSHARMLSYKFCNDYRIFSEEISVLTIFSPLHCSHALLEKLVIKMYRILYICTTQSIYEVRAVHEVQH